MPAKDTAASPKLNKPLGSDRWVLMNLPNAASATLNKEQNDDSDRRCQAAGSRCSSVLNHRLNGVRSGPTHQVTNPADHGVLRDGASEGN